MMLPESQDGHVPADRDCVAQAPLRRPSFQYHMSLLPSLHQEMQHQLTMQSVCVEAQLNFCHTDIMHMLFNEVCCPGMCEQDIAAVNTTVWIPRTDVR